MTDLETLEKFKTLVNYDRETGLFVWNSDPSRGPKTKGRPAIKKTPFENMIQARIAGKKIAVTARRLAVFICTGGVPLGPVTTLNGISHDDRFENLQVGKSPCHKRKCVSGVSFHKQSLSWRSRVIFAGIEYSKLFENELDAKVWAIEKRNELGFDGHLHGRASS